MKIINKSDIRNVLIIWIIAIGLWIVNIIYINAMIDAAVRR